MLDGFHQMDEPFGIKPFEKNLPVILGLLGIRYNAFFGAQTVAVLPYEQYLRVTPLCLRARTPWKRHGASSTRCFAQQRRSYEYDPGTCGPPGASRLIGPPGGWHVPAVGGNPKEVLSAA